MRTPSVLAAALLVSAAFAPQAQAARPLADFALGQNSEAQDCRAQARFDVPAGVQAADIYCGAWERPSGQVSAQPRANEAAALAALAQDCRGPETVLASGEFSELRQIACERAAGSGLRRYGLIARRGDRLVVGSAYPADWGPLLAAARVLSGAAPARAAQLQPGEAPGLREIQAVYPAGVPGQAAAVNHELLRRRAFENNGAWNFAAAHRDYAELLRAQEIVAPDELVGQAEILAEIGLNLSGQRRFSEAEDAFDRAETLARRAGANLLGSKIANYRALDQLNQRRPGKALELAQGANRARDALEGPNAAGAGVTAAEAEALESGAAAGRRRALVAPLTQVTDKDRAAVMSAQADYVSAIAARSLGQPTEALAHLDRAGRRLNAAGLRPAELVAMIYGERSRLRAARGDGAGALREAETGLALLRRESAGTRAEGHLLLVTAEARQRQGDLAGALRDGRAAVTLFGRQREAPGMPADVAEPHLRSLLQGAAADPALAREYFETLALVWDGAASRSAAQLAARMAAQASGETVRAYQDAERNYRAALTRRERLSNNPDAAKPAVEAADRAVSKAAEALEAAEAELRSNAPKYLELLSPRVPAGELMQALEPGEAYLRLVVGEQGGFGALVTRDAIHPFRLDLTAGEAEQLAGKLRKSASLRSGRLPDYDLTAAKALFDKLIAPVGSQLANVDRLQIDAGGALAGVPFAALLESAPTEAQLRAIRADQDYRGLAWLGRRVSVATALGPAPFVRMRKSPSPAARVPAMTFGDFRPDPALVAERVARNRGLSDRCRMEIERALAQLQALPETGIEAQQIAALLGGGSQAVLSEAFTEKAVLENRAVGDAAVLVLATHGVLNLSTCFSEPALLASVGPESDGLIEASEILNISLRARLVVLSACDTAAGSQSDAAVSGLADGGEALSGLARAFIYAGASSVLATHWKVDSETTSKQTHAFLAAAALPDTPLAAALSQSQRALYDAPETAHPFYWAGFVLIGDGATRLPASDGVQTAGQSTP